MNKVDLKKLIFELCSAQGVSGSEAPALSVARKYCEPLGETGTDYNGNLYVTLGDPEADRTIILDAHLDRIGFIVTGIDDKGFVKVDKLGGVDIRTLQDAVLQTESGIKGTVCCLPPHLSIGDTLTFCAEPRELLGDKITAPALDDRCGIAALIRAAELINTDKYRVVLLFSVQEETYGTGAKTA